MNKRQAIRDARAILRVKESGMVFVPSDVLRALVRAATASDPAVAFLRRQLDRQEESDGQGRDEAHTGTRAEADDPKDETRTRH